MRLLCIAFLFQTLLGSCQWHDILDSEFIFCEATKNGISYKDASTVRKSLGYERLPFARKKRFFIGYDSVAYLQFRLTNINIPDDCLYLFGGIVYPENEKFPLLNKEYIIKYNQEFETNKSAAYNFAEYLYEQRKNNKNSLPIGIILLNEENGEYTNSLEGKLIFNSYNSKNHTYQGYFQLYREDREFGYRNYTIIGQFDV